VTGLPSTDCLIVAVATPITPELHPDSHRLLRRCRDLMADGCDGVTLFGTTGEGAEFTVADRRGSLEAVLAGNIDPRSPMSSSWRGRRSISVSTAPC